MKKIYYSISGFILKPFLCLFLFSLLPLEYSKSQQIIGSFPNMNGGFEGLSSGSITATALSTTDWTIMSSSNYSATLKNGDNNARTGNAYIEAIQSGNITKRLHSPKLANSSLASQNWTVQCYYKGDLDGVTLLDSMSLALNQGGTWKYGGWQIGLNTSTWTKLTFNTTTAVTGDLYGAIRMSNTCQFNFDDFVIYPGAVDNTAPDPATIPVVSSQTSTQQTLSWTAPGTGVDGGGYMVVRGTTDPSTTPNVNGIYGVGNNLGSGTVVYIGTANSFTDTGLSAGTTYYYRIYTADKAFNYSAALQTSGTTSAASFATEPTAQVSGLNFTSIGSSSMTINWTPAVSGGGTNHLVIVKAGSDINADPADGTSYTASTTLGSGTSIGGGSVTYNGTGNSVTITGLSALTNYYVRVYDFNGSGGTENYYTTSPASANQTSDRKTITSAQDGSFKTASTWVGGVVPTATDNAVVAHNIEVTGSNGGSCYNLTINSGAKLYGNNTAFSAALINVYGTNVDVAGTFDAASGASEVNQTSIQFYQNCTLSGSGTIKINRIKPGTNVTNATFTFDANTSLVNSSLCLIYDNSGNSNIGYTINSGKTVDVTGQIVTVSTSTLTVNGTLNMLSGSIADFSTEAYASGTGTFNLNSGATIKIGAADGLKSSSGSVRCSTRNLDSGANYQFVGSSAQTTSGIPGGNNDFPSQINNLIINNAAGLTQTGSITVNGTTTLTSGILNTSLFSLFTKGNVSGSGSIDANNGTLYFYGATQTFASTVNGQVSIAPGVKVTNTGTMLNGPLYINSDQNGTGTFINNGTATFSSANIQQYLASARNYYVSSPAASASAVVNSNIVNYYEYVESGDNTSTSVSGSTAYWKGYNSAFTMTVGKGYIAQTSAAATPVTFVGALNDNASYSIPLTRTNTALKPGFNLVGNPYPAYLNWSAVIADAGNANISTTMWYKTKNTGNAYTFATHNGTSGITVSGTANTTITQYIPPMQGFWVRVNDGTSSTNLTVSKSMLSHRDVTGNTLKAKEVTSNTILRLKVSNGTNEDENVLYFNSNASNSLDNYDSPKMSNNNADIPEIYTLANNEKLVINGMQSIPYNTEIPLGFVTGTDGTNFSIKASEISGFDSDVQIALIDQTAQTETILNGTNSYDFASGISSGTGRFSVMFKTASGITSTTVVGEEQPVIYQTATGETAVNLAALSKGGLIRLFNAQGQQLIQMTTTQSTTLLPKQSTKGVYIVSIQVDNKNFQQKIVIK